ncbi:hypothetical protein [Nonomuraea soli]|uniref:Uncharacterized protein n=1 Tax=Nonomuraea soli TaxID=1032476 RepID=A0A7W0CHA4_9ACTN|nr:hypothetical protein [Nonomuraea soli]MBA2891091.1 hypothetical protein [Nonomuraea soli]
MTSPEGPHERAASRNQQAVEGLRSLGNLALIAGAGLLLGAWLVTKGDPPLGLIAVCCTTSLVGMGFRLEAVIRERR